ncbi:hypothetical protein HMPREF9154_0054 [Arachnia propionica F0230a]|nr:hypothetical protein HMPREF9154_0054 [Arachnia propionica F0230a]
MSNPLFFKEPLKSAPPPVHETQEKNGSTSCGDVEPSNLRDS